MQLRFLLIIFFVSLFFCGITAWHFKATQSGNNAPQIIIKKPSSGDTFDWNSLVNYEISVTDKEDGNSAYGEIAANEVLMKIKYLPDSVYIRAYLAGERKNPEQKGLTLIRTSDCFNCHATKNKLIGPSFEAIAKKYSGNANAIAMLANKVIKGSALVWGEEKMPPHPDMTIKKAAEITNWIMKNCSDSNIDYIPGIEGTFHTKAKPQKNAAKGVYILTAYYTDHGLPQSAEQSKEGRNTILLKSK